MNRRNALLTADVKYSYSKMADFRLGTVELP
jgi:hypothetical protein